MSSRIQTVSLAVGEPVIAVSPQTYIRATSVLFDPDTVGIDVDAAAGPAVAGVADLNGYRGAIVTIFHTPSTTNNAAAVSARLKHGPTNVYSEHDYVSSDLEWAFLQPGVGLGGTMEMLTFLVDSSRVERYLSVEGLISNGVGTIQAAIITPVGAKYARKDNVDQANNLFVTASGSQTFPSLDPT